MKKRYFALFLTLTLLLAMLSACGGTDSQSGSDETPETATPAEVPGEQPPEAEPDTEPEPEALTYPLAVEEGTTISTWATMKGTYAPAFEQWNDCYILEHAAEATGVNLDVMSVSDSVAVEQYQMMLASGQWPDFIPMNYYTGGVAQAYEDGIIINITDEQLAEFAPDYDAIRLAQDDSSFRAMKESGMNLSVYTIMDKCMVGSGLVIRQDWLDELDMSTPSTLDEFTKTLLAFHDNFDCDSALRLYSEFTLEQFNAAFDTRCVGYANKELPVYRNGDSVTCSFVEDNYRGFVEWIAELYSKGAINQDFYSQGNGGPDRFSDVVAGRTGLWTDNAGTVNDWVKWSDDDPELLDAEAVANPRGADGSNTWGDEKIAIGDGFSRTGWSITSTCEDPELVLRYFNYYFTEAGSMMGNYGVEGIGYELAPDGSVVLLDAIVNNEYGLNPGGSISINSMLNLVPHYQFEERLFSTLDEDAVEAYELYNDPSITCEHYYPYGASLTSAETDGITNTVTALLTYAQEQLMAFMTNAVPVTDESWEGFQNTMKDMGIEDCLAVYQSAYDEYAAGER